MNFEPEFQYLFSGEYVSTPPRPFLECMEVWSLNPSRNRLQILTADYGDATQMREVSDKLELAANEGLPGAVITEGVPVVFTGDMLEQFHRYDAAMADGITAALGLPIYIGDQIASIVVLMMRTEPNHIGAIEAWLPDTPRRELQFGTGYYVGLDGLHRTGRHIRWPHGSGLPGLTWKLAMPQFVHGLDRSSSFVRGADAKEAGLSLALSLPLITGKYIDDAKAVCLLLSSRKTPLAKAIGVWLPSADRKQLTLTKFYRGDRDQDGIRSFEDREQISIEGFQGIAGQAWSSRTPVVGSLDSDETPGFAQHLEDLNATRAIAIPTLVGNSVQAVSMLID